MLVQRVLFSIQAVLKIADDISIQQDGFAFPEFMDIDLLRICGPPNRSASEETGSFLLCWS